MVTRIHRWDADRAIGSPTQTRRSGVDWVRHIAPVRLSVRNSRRLVIRLEGLSLWFRRNLLQAKVKPKIHSFDVFDTVITRSVLDPSHVHWGVAGTGRAFGWLDQSDENWRRIRLDAEADARRIRNGEEIRLRDIYDQIRTRLGWDDALTQRVSNLEVAFEYRLSSPIRSIWRAVAPKSVDWANRIFISDTYLGRDEVAMLLAKADLGCERENVYVSSEFGASKMRGDLFALVAARRGLRCTDISHLGDNYISDVLSARRAGVAARQVRLPSTSVYERILHEHGGETYVGSVIAGAARATRLRFDGSFPANPGLTAVSAAVAGPVLMAFVLWVLCEAEDRDLDRLFFLARDGQILARLANKIATWAGFSIDCRYLLASRQAFYLSSLPRQHDEAIEAILRGATGKTVGAVLTELEIEPESALSAMKRVGLTFSTLIGSEGTLCSLRALLSYPDIAAALDRLKVERSDALIAYLREEGFVSARPAGVVDLGWLGNLQLRLEHSISGHTAAPPIGFYYGLYGHDPSLSGRALTFCPTPTWHNQLLETMCLADHSSVRGFRRDSNGLVEPIIDHASDAGAIAWGVHVQQEVILSYADAVMDALDPAVVSPRELLERMRPAATAALNRLIAAPSRTDADAYGSALHAADQAHQFEMEIAPKLGAVALLGVVASRTSRSRATCWPQGMIARSSGNGPASVLRLLLLLRFRWNSRRRVTSSG